MSITLIRVTHQQQTKRSILVDKVDKSQGNSTGYAQKAKQAVYVPFANPSDSTVKGYIDMVPTDEVLLSAASGTIAGLKAAGHVDAVAFSSSLIATPVVSGAALVNGNFTITGTTLASLAPDLTYVKVTNLSPSTQTVSQGSFATTLTGLMALANELKADYNAHRTQSGIHSANDTTNVVTSSNATDLPSTITLLNELKSDFNAHRTQSGVHASNDSTNVIASANATDFETAVALANELKADYNAHRASATFHSAADTTNVVSSSYAASISATKIVLPASAVTGSPTTGWKVQVQANSKLSNTLTL